MVVMQKKQPAIFLMGPTAVGKSEFALQLAEKLPIEIISVDSAVVYRGMNIGTGKPTLVEMARVPHHLIDIRDPSEPYSAAEFAKDALIKMSEITARGCIPVLVGGTFLYFRALQQGLSPLPSSDPKIREQLLKEGEEKGWPAMHQRLAGVDPTVAKRIHPNDAQRIQRALEVYEISHKPMSSFFPPHPNPLPLGGEPNRNEVLFLEGKGNIKDFEIKSFALMPESRLELHQKIEQRFYEMLKRGLVQEVEGFFNREDLYNTMPSMRAVGYRQVWMYLEKAYSYDEMVLKAIAATRQLAKRQLTWLRSLSDIFTFQNSGLASLETVIHCALQKGEFRG